MELLNSVVASMIPMVVSTISKHVTYPFKVDNNIRDLELAVQALEASKQDLETSIKNADRKHGVPTYSTDNWLNQVKAIVKEEQHIKAEYQQRRRCLWNHCADIWTDYKISKRAAEKQAEAKSWLDKRPTLDEAFIIEPPSYHEIPISTSYSMCLQAALDHINGNVNNTIGIWGMGGVGKTHLLHQINFELCRRKKREEVGAFDFVILVECSHDWSEEKVQDEIISMLELDENLKPKHSNIYHFLKNRSFVLLLDNLWSHVNLKKVGIPDPTRAVDTCKRKIVLTTRSKEICRQMEVTEIIKVDVLNPKEAWSLFMEKVKEETIKSHPRIMKYAENVTKELGGLPLALINVGKAMHDRREISDWASALNLIKEARLNEIELSIPKKESVFDTLKPSYDNLKTNTMKECFLHCSLWPKNHSIKRDELVELWMGEGLIIASEMQLAYDVGYNNIRKLQDVCLLEEGEADGELVVKLNYMIRDMALWIANDQRFEKKKWIVRAGGFKDSMVSNFSCETEKLSLMHNNKENYSIMFSSGSPKLTTLLLNSNSLNKSTPLLNSNSMNKSDIRLGQLSGLIVLDLSRNGLHDFPVDICKLINLQFLNLSENHIQSLPNELAALVLLRYLLLRKNEIGPIPYGMLCEMKHLRVLDLSSSYLSSYPLSFLEDLKNLADFKALGIAVTDMEQFNTVYIVPIRWLEVSMHIKTDLFIFSDNFLRNSKIQKHLYSLEISIGGVERIKFESKHTSACTLEILQQLKIYNMDRMKYILWENLDPKDVFSSLEILVFYRCRDLRSISWVVYLPCLRELEVSFCHSLEQLIDTNERNEASCRSFPFLKKMDLRHLYYLESICDSNNTLEALETMRVESCHKLKMLPFKADNIPSKLRLIQGSEEWWKHVEWEHGSLETLLQHFFSALV